LYGDKIADFEEEFLQESEDGELVAEPVKMTVPVYEKIYLDLQGDEIEFSNPRFKSLYPKLIDIMLLSGKIDVNLIMTELTDEEAAMIADLIMGEDRYQLHRWDEKQIFVKTKEDTVAVYVMDTILNFRRLMIQEKIKALSNELTTNEAADAMDILAQVKDHLNLQKYLGSRLNRVV
jgi:DNA primase